MPVGLRHLPAVFVRGLLAVVFALFLAMVGAMLWPKLAAAQAPAKPDILEVLEISGAITGFEAKALEKRVEEIGDNQRVKAVLLVVNTPGGSVSGSSAIHAELSKVKVPVVGYCEAICASGGVFALTAPSVKYIGVGPTTIAGSIGVVMSISRFHRLLDWAKVDVETYTSGSLKDAGNSTRARTEEERKYLQGIADSLAAQFYDIVGKSRKITNWPEVKTARVFIGEEAVKIGLADAVITKDQAIAKAKELSGSKLIFTRDELKKMSKAAEGPAHYEAPTLAPRLEAPSPWGDVPALVEIIKEIRAGESTVFEYRMPMRF